MATTTIEALGMIETKGLVAMIEAASHSENRLPEAFSGYERSFGRVPVPYPTACNPQAWASGAPLLFLRTVLGLEVRDGRIEVDADVPREFGRVQLVGTNAFAVMNNHFRGQAVANALQLQQMLIGETRAAPETLRDTYPQIAGVTRTAERTGQRRLF